MSFLPEVNWERIESFVGFGRRDAPVVFIGMEERLDSDSTLHADLVRRSAYDQVMDLRKAHEGIVNAARRFDPRRTVIQWTWRPMCDLMLRRRGQIEPTLTDRKQYQAQTLGSSGADGETLLTELLPYPAKSTAHWPYEKYGKYSTREQYRNSMLPLRKKLLRRVLAENEHELVICYGKSNWRDYQNLFDEAEWCEIGPFRKARIAKTQILLTPPFATKGFNTTKQLAYFAKVALA